MTPPAWTRSIIEKINAHASQLIFIHNDSSTDEVEKDYLYYAEYKSLNDLIGKINNFGTLLLVWQPVLASLNEAMKNFSYRIVKIPFDIISCIFESISTNY
jgi:hypothetical protein